MTRLPIQGRSFLKCQRASFCVLFRQNLGAVYHDGNAQASPDEIRYANYVNYGRRFEQLLRDCGWNL